METLEILQASSQEQLMACLHLRTAVFSEEKGVPQEEERDKWDHLGSGCLHYLVLWGGCPAGTVRFIPAGEKELRLQRFCFLPQFRGLGLGRRVLTRLEEEFRRRGILRIGLDAKYQVKGFYEACGYHTVSDVFMEVGVPHVSMARQL